MVRGGQVHRRLLLVVLEAGAGAILHEERDHVGAALHRSEVEGCAPVLIEAVDVGPVHEEGLDHADLARCLVEHGVVERGPPCVVRHVHQVASLSGQDRKDLLGGVL